MAQHRPNVPPALKRQLVHEAGGKCANPGCPNARVHLHHIREWAVYETHDGAHMIALCPACHDTVHHGDLRIEDPTLYRWKSIERALSHRDQIFVEPGRAPKLLLGTVAVAGDSGLVVLELSARNRLSFRLEDGDVFLVDVAIASASGVEVLRIVGNHVKVAIHEDVDFRRRPGKIRVTVPNTPEYVAADYAELIRQRYPEMFPDDRAVMLDLEVLAPGLVKVQGIWLEGHRGLVATPDTLILNASGILLPIVGAGESSVIYYRGSATLALFGP